MRRSGIVGTMPIIALQSMNCLLQFDASAQAPNYWIRTSCTENQPSGSVPLRSSPSSVSARRRRSPVKRRSEARRRASPRRRRHKTGRPTRPLVRSRVARKLTGRAHDGDGARDGRHALPRYKVDASGDLVPDLRAAAAIVYDPETNQVLWEENSQDQRSIASITKVMTATVFLENNPDLTQPVTIARSDVYQASTTHLRANDKVTTDDLLHLLLIASDNAAARALARVSPYGSDGFIQRHEREGGRARAAKARTTPIRRVCCPTTCRRRTTWRGSSRTRRADERISSIMRLSEYTVYDEPHAPSRSTARTICSAGRTSTSAPGRPDSSRSRATASRRCSALPESGQQVAVVVLGARSNAGRFMESRNLFNWVSSKASTLFAPKPTSQQ